MNRAETEQLVRQTMELIGADAPEIMDQNAPVLGEEGEGIYLVGLIGGKEVGKSALVNALVGTPITDETSHGPGTQRVVAYVHRSRQRELAELLERHVPGKFRIVPHEESRLGGQVLLDLPDIDSRFTAHVELTRRMLRHMLFPIWIQSVEKYADVQPQNLLSKVASGNDPSNFLFCLNKVDQLSQNGQAGELREDYAGRIQRVLALESQPRVFMIAARHPLKFDLPELSKLLSREKSADTVAHSRELAGRRQQRTLLSWLIGKDLPGRARRLGRLDDEASELLAQRLGVPLVETAIPAMIDDPAYRMVMTDGVFARRVSRWPIVNVLHAVMSPIRLLIRENAAAGSFFGGAEALVDARLKSGGESMATLVQSAFGQLYQADPSISGLYSRRKLWETMDAQMAEAAIRRELVETVKRQRQEVLGRLSGRAGFIAPVFRVLLTIGALLWFPFVQPVLHTILNSHSAIGTARDVGILLVEVVSAESLLRNAVFLILWYLLIWSLLRWDTLRRVDRLLRRWKSAEYGDDALNLTTRVLQWIEDLLEPIRTERLTTERLAGRVETLEAELGDEAKSAA